MDEIMEDWDLVFQNTKKGSQFQGFKAGPFSLSPGLRGSRGSLILL